MSGNNFVAGSRWATMPHCPIAVDANSNITMTRMSLRYINYNLPQGAVSSKTASAVTCFQSCLFSVALLTNGQKY